MQKKAEVVNKHVSCIHHAVVHTLLCFVFLYLVTLNTGLAQGHLLLYIDEEGSLSATYHCT